MMSAQKKEGQTFVSLTHSESDFCASEEEKCVF